MIETLAALADRDGAIALTAYAEAVDTCLRDADPAIAEEVRGLIGAHLHDALAHQTTPLSLSAIRQTLHDLGDPDDFVPDWTEAIAMQRAQAGFSPDVAVRSVLSGFAAGGGRALCALIASAGYALAVVLLVGGVAAIIAPGSVGLFELETGVIQIGTRAGADAEIKRDLLGHWFAPLMLLGALAGYIASAFLMKLSLPRPQNRRRDRDAGRTATR